MKTLEEVKALNYDHHTRMTKMHLENVAKGIHTLMMDDTESYLSLLNDVPKDRNIILELGSASGGQWKLLEDWCPSKQIFGIDLFEPAVTTARERGLPISLGFVEDMSHIFPAGHFDLVCSRHVMEHLGDVDRGIEEIKRVLAPGAYTAHVTPDLPFDDEPAHLNKWKAAVWERIWSDHDFEILSVDERPYNHGEVHLVARKPAIEPT
jgi:SAM-dependent methyltransferase